MDMVKERERQRKARKMQVERAQESSEAKGDVTALGLLQRSADRLTADPVPEPEEPENDEVPGEGSAFGGLVANAVKQPRCVCFLKCPVPELIICSETNSGGSTRG